MTAIERAYELARTGKYLNFTQIKKALSREFNVNQELEGRQLATALTRLCQQARNTEHTRRPEPPLNASR